VFTEIYISRGVSIQANVHSEANSITKRERLTVVMICSESDVDSVTALTD